MALSNLRAPEHHKRPGLHYVFTDDGIELPVVDVTHPAFAFDLGSAELDAQVASFVRDARRRERMPRFLANLILRVALRRSILARGLREAEKATFLAGLHTYLFKLGPELLGAGYAQPIDRRIAASLPAVSMRLRFLDMARQLVAGIAPVLRARRSPLELVSLGGGPSAESWNALILLRKSHPELIEGRPVRVHTLDVDVAGPAFGARALAALKEPGAPLHGLDLTHAHTRYDWADAGELPRILPTLDGDAPIVAVCSEGALFEYASDAEVAANLEALHRCTPADAVVVGSATGDDEIATMVHRGSRIPLHPRSAEAFAVLVEAAGWRVQQSIQRPTCRDVLMTKR